MKNRLKEYRNEAGLTLEQLADLCGSTKSYIHALEAGRSVAGLMLAYAISTALKKSVYEVFPDQQEYETETVTRTRKVK